MIQELLNRVPLFHNLSEEDFRRICGMIEEIDLPAGETLFDEGSPGDRAYIIQSGELEVVKATSGRDVLLAVRGPGDVIGEMSLIEDVPRTATVRARTDARLAVISHEQFDRLLDTSPTAARTMLQVVLARLRETEGLLRQSEKMAQLGVLVAGIAHELNNPAAAVKRGADHLQATIDELETLREELANCALDEGQRRLLDELEGVLTMTATPITQIDALALSDLEETLLDMLEANAVPDAWRLVPALVEIGMDKPLLDRVITGFPSEYLHTVLEWLAARYNAHQLLNEIGQGAVQVSEIVQALKTYSYLDRGPVQRVDVHEGLENTLVILRSKLKKGIRVTKDYAPDLPMIDAYGSELNQVWTNLIDNAADAVGESSGEITLRTRPAEGGILVEVEDNGAGISAEAQARIFEPFFTTKPPGHGTGLGLDISYNIVTLKHGGEITFESEPGRTVFRVWLPAQIEGV